MHKANQAFLCNLEGVSSPYIYADTQKELTAKLRPNIDICQGIALTEQSRMILTEWLERWLGQISATRSERQWSRAIPTAPADGCRLPPAKAREMQVLTHKEIQPLIIQAKEDGCFVMWTNPKCRSSNAVKSAEAQKEIRCFQQKTADFIAPLPEFELETSSLPTAKGNFL